MVGILYPRRHTRFGLDKMRNTRMKTKMSFRPSSFWYIFVLSSFGLLALFFTGYALHSLFMGEPLMLFDFIVIESRIIQFILFLLISGMLGYFFVDIYLLHINFEGEFIIVPKKRPMQTRSLKLECRNLVAYKVLFPGEKDN